MRLASPQRDRFPLLLDVANGLQFLHIMGIIHSDLKGQNVLITNKYRAVITDFGSSRAVSTTTAASTTTTSSYTLYFAAPEVSLGGEKMTTMSDVWSFGCLIFQTLSRKPPYYQYLPMQVISVLLRRDPPLRPGMEPILRPILRPVLSPALATVPSQVTSSATKSDSDFEEVSDEDEDGDEDEDEDRDWDPIDDNAWSLVLQCCASQPYDRIKVYGIQQAIKAILTF
ncbi:hypothetical protein NP233_g10665 [Leucocoprinus birnbaumii]|uniref:Protein kinase domain-containing protein n=1 Tax=Leucocoprinus birnbaumii TaxID=56174 RepID=A0AAD5VIV5_9AGAR|nr:hypothetical protein NP233_g10665 [Leucocoprinus birnbaumii]